LRQQGDKRKLDWIEAQAWLSHRIFATKLALIWGTSMAVSPHLCYKACAKMGPDEATIYWQQYLVVCI